MDTRTLTLGHFVECISRDLESGKGDAFYGVSDVVAPESVQSNRSATREVLIAGAGGTLGAIGIHVLGL